MKRIILSAFALILTACAAPQPQVTITREVTVTPPPTATVIPTPTIPPAFLDVQEQVAANCQSCTIMNNGQIEAKLPDGTIGVVNGITLNKDGTSYTLTVNGEEVTIGIDKVSISDENGVQIEGYEDPDGDGDFSEVIKYTSDAWASMDQTARDAALAKLPETTPYTTADGQEVVLTRGGFSENIDYLVKYYDAQGVLQSVYNLETGEYGDPLDNGIYELVLTTGETWEVRGFHTGMEALNYAGGEDGAHGTTMDMQSNKDRSSVEPKVYRIVGWLQQGEGRFLSDG